MCGSQTTTTLPAAPIVTRRGSAKSGNRRSAQPATCSACGRHRITDRERARIYRRKNKEDARLLVASVGSLRVEVRQLSLKAQVLRGLLECNVDQPARDRILTLLVHFAQNPCVVVPGFDVQQLDLLGATCSGSQQSPVVQIEGRVVGRYPHASLESVYASIPGNSVLLDSLMHTRFRYPCMLRLYFSSEAELTATKVELDWFVGLMESLRRLDDVVKVIRAVEALGPPRLQLV